MPVQEFYNHHSELIQALQHTCTFENKKEMREFHRQVCGAFGSKSIFIETSAGPTEARVGDWVLKYPDGKFYVCSDEEFQATQIKNMVK